ncbi:PREDICTED: trihelix transcription factor GTL1 isoform X2 [Nelumbo nucifera]|uniref:Myb-like domain-containing protein n=2 Tax=Nelumbo nucifera TaxID=4432 RepID=A0A822YWZ9_NELNU|nr:PREDICTED: trihelix transcription factor GTL1 isoform X2 [Nelumbo nucifera]DAD36061.1 TPA_asm: hypothetical protein HUJ06_006701 [Nelumbo nucifera]
MQQGGTQYGMSPEMTAFTGTGTRSHMVGGVSSGSDHLQQQQQQQQQQLLQQQKKSGDAAIVVAEAASPISSRPPSVTRSSGNFEELVPVSGGFPDDDALAGEEAERGVAGGNRWPRQETLALLKIRSEMDSAFRDATLKGPLWEDVSRKLAELGYVRSAKKCKEKFENVHKYYKRTKEGRAGRQDGKSYRFFSQLEALHTNSSGSNNIATSVMPAATTTATTNPSSTAAPAPITMGGRNPMVGSTGRVQAPQVSASPATDTTQIGVPRVSPSDLGAAATASAAATTTGISFSSNTSSSSSDSEDDLEAGGPSNTDSRKRKRGSRGGSSRMMSFFEGLMKQVMERQEAMQQRFLETIEKREQDRIIREEAWRRQEMARLTREHEIMAQERAISSSRDAAIISFLQKITGQTIQFPPPISIPAAPPPQPIITHPPPSQHQHQQQQQQPQPQPQPQQQQQPPQPHHQHHQSQSAEIVRHQPASSEVIIAIPEQQVPQEMSSGGRGGSFDPTSSRWPKAEVHALIKMRSGLESRYQEAGPKGPLWEEISAGMQRMGYNRSAKRCKEKWENINKYFKKVKESNKKRPEDAKTCPYFHQLDALYRKKILGSSSGSTSFGNQNRQEEQPQQLETMDPSPTTTNLPERGNALTIMSLPPSNQTSETEDNKNNNNNNNNGGSTTEVQTSNGGLPPGTAMKKKTL